MSSLGKFGSKSGFKNLCRAGFGFKMSPVYNSALLVTNVLFLFSAVKKRRKSSEAAEVCQSQNQRQTGKEINGDLVFKEGEF